MTGGTEEKTWFVRVLLALGCCLLGLSCYLVLRLTTVIDRLEGDAEVIAENQRKVSETAARIAAKLDRIMDWEEGALEKVRSPFEEVGTALDEIKSAHANKVKLDEAATTKMEDEVGGLLSGIRRSGWSYERDGRETSALKFYGYLWAKYRLLEDGLGSTEDFIDKVATKTVTGKTYYVLREGKKEELATYLREELKKIREKE